MSVRIAPALLGADPLDLASSIKQVEGTEAACLHLDVMDGQYTPSISFGLRTVRAVRKLTGLPVDVHLQTVDPERLLEELIDIGVDRVSLHIDAAHQITDTLHLLGQARISKGLVLNPDLSIDHLEPYLPQVDVVVLMTSIPGTSRFQPAVIAKIAALRARLDEIGLDTVDLVADGGITAANAAQIIEAGADTLVAASAVFGSADGDIPAAIARLSTPDRTIRR
ncbi:ribulose-phosphate 3-epimerase [Nocardia sp. NPDC006630]|uniref:ribulose-phosphate 3-epimerase n=1 Tax=Nocardia sp. NPDC006630 TaxID=3157181 RepID=UPI0033B2DAC2